MYIIKGEELYFIVNPCTQNKKGKKKKKEKRKEKSWLYNLIMELKLGFQLVTDFELHQWDIKKNEFNFNVWWTNSLGGGGW